MGISIVLFCILVLIGSRPSLHFKEDYARRRNTLRIQGILVFFVFIDHICQYLTIEYGILELPFVIVKDHIGQMVVAPFLFYSGYGLMLSLCEKRGYADTLLKNRVLKLLIHFDIAVLIYAIIQLVVMKTTYPIHEYITALIGWNSIGNSNWFIFATLVMYVVFTACANLISNRRVIPFVQFFACLVYIVIISQFKKDVFYNTILCFPFGMMFYFIKEKYDSIMRTGVGFIVIIVSAILLLASMKYVPIYNIRSLLFCCLIISLSTRWGVESKCLTWLGKHIFSVYIFQRIPMILFLETGLISNEYLAVAVCLFFTVLISIVFDKIYGNIDRILFADRQGIC